MIKQKMSGRALGLRTSQKVGPRDMNVEDVTCSSKLVKVLPVLPLSFLLQGGWAWRGTMARDLRKVLEESKEGKVRRRLVNYCGTWSPKLVKIPRKIPVAVDLETLRNKRGAVTQVNWATEDALAYAGGWNQEIREEIREAVEQDRITVLHNGMFDEGELYLNGIQVEKIWDTMIGAAILDPDMPNNLEHVAKDCTDLPVWKHLSGVNMREYGCYDADATIRIFNYQRRQLAVENVRAVFDTSMEVLPLLIDMRRKGLRISVDTMEKMAEECSEEEEKAKDELNKEVGKVERRKDERRVLLDKAAGNEDDAERLREVGKKGLARKLETEAKKWKKQADGLVNVNWNSSQQLMEVLDDLGLPRKYKKDGRQTTEAATMQELARVSGNPILLRLLDYRKYNKRRTTFLQQKFAGSERVHPTFLLHRDYDIEGGMEGACTGRLACKDPNMQNWPKEVRRIVVPDEDGWEMAAADYNQIEFRIMAWKVGGELWKLVNTKGFDVHRAVASEVYGKLAKDVTEEERHLGKTSVYAGIYGVGPLTFSRQLMKKGVFLKVAECKKFLNAFKKLFPDVRRAHEGVMKEAYATNKVTNPFGRFRRFYKPFAEATAIYNIYPQSTAGDVILKAMAKLRKQLPKSARVAIQVHDELVFTYPREMRKEVLECVTDVMTEKHPELPGMTFPISLKAGDSWGSMSGVKEII